jgi:hypothetical protein
VDAICTDNDQVLTNKCAGAEQIQRVMYESYVPSYAVSYDCLGDQEAFSLKYTWELAVYFGFLVFPMVNNFFANAEFMPNFLRRFGILGSINANLQRTLSAFFQWKKAQPRQSYSEPNLFEFYEMAPLHDAEKLFYQTGLQPSEAIDVLDQHLARLQEFARYIIVHIHASVLGNREVLTNASFIASLSLRNTVFAPDKMSAAYAPFADDSKIHRWDLNPFVLENFIVQRASRAFSTGEASSRQPSGARVASVS